MNYFSSDQFQPKLVRKMLDPESGSTIRLFECLCGERARVESRGLVASRTTGA